MSISYKSTIDFPVQFFINYPVGGRDFLYQAYKKLDHADEYFDIKENRAYRLFGKRDAEGLTSTIRIEYPFEQFIYDRIDYEILESKDFITQFYTEIKNKGENELAYLKLLRAFIENFTKLNKISTYPEAELLPQALIEVVKHSMHLYRKLFKTHLDKQVRSIIEAEDISAGLPVYNLIKDYHKNIPEFNQKLIDKIFIDSETTVYQWYSFFNGKKPSKINWIGAPQHLKYFIDHLLISGIIINPPKQRCKKLPWNFLLKGKTLETDFYKNHTYIREYDKKKINDIINSLKRK